MGVRLKWWEVEAANKRRWEEQEKLHQHNRDVQAGKLESAAVPTGNRLTQHEQESQDRANKAKQTFEEQQQKSASASRITWGGTGGRYTSPSVREQTDPYILATREAERQAQAEQERLAQEAKRKAEAAAKAAAAAKADKDFRDKHAGMSPLEVQLENAALDKTLASVSAYDQQRIGNWLVKNKEVCCDVTVRAAMADLQIQPQF